MKSTEPARGELPRLEGRRKARSARETSARPTWPWTADGAP